MDAKTITIIAGAVVGAALLATGVTVAVKVKKQCKEKEDDKGETVETATEESTIPEQPTSEQQKDDKVVTPNFTQVNEKQVNPGFVNDTTITNPEAPVAPVQ